VIYTTGWISYKRQPLLDVPSHPRVPDVVIMYFDVRSITEMGKNVHVELSHVQSTAMVALVVKTYICLRSQLHDDQVG
jgi:hypothetical protein